MTERPNFLVADAMPTALRWRAREAKKRRACRYMVLGGERHNLHRVHPFMYPC